VTGAGDVLHSEFSAGPPVRFALRRVTPKYGVFRFTERPRRLCAHNRRASGVSAMKTANIGCSISRLTPAARQPAPSSAARLLSYRDAMYLTACIIQPRCCVAELPQTALGVKSVRRYTIPPDWNRRRSASVLCVHSRSASDGSPPQGDVESRGLPRTNPAVLALCTVRADKPLVRRAPPPPRRLMSPVWQDIMPSSDNKPPSASSVATQAGAEQWLIRRHGVGVGVPECSRACLIRLIDYPELPIRCHLRETISCGRNSLVVKSRLAFHGQNIPVVYKKYRPRRWWNVLRGLLRKRRALRAWKVGHALRRQRIDTPRPLAAIVPRHMSESVDSYLAREWVPGWSLHDVLQHRFLSNPATWLALQKRAAEETGRLLGRFHAAGFRHPRLKANGILLRSDPATPENVSACLYDVDGVRPSRFVNRRQRIHDLRQLAAAFLSQPTLPPPVPRQFVEAYLSTLEIAPGDERQQCNDWWQQLRAAAERFQHPRSGKRSA